MAQVGRSCGTYRACLLVLHTANADGAAELSQVAVVDVQQLGALRKQRSGDAPVPDFLEYACHAWGSRPRTPKKWSRGSVARRHWVDSMASAMLKKGPSLSRCPSFFGFLLFSI